MTVHVLVLSTKFGNDIDVYATGALAKEALAAWVLRFWPNDLGPAPADEDDLIERYFEDSAQDDYLLSEEEVQGL